MAVTNQEPQTFSERWKRWTRPPRYLTLTRAGKFLCLIALAIGFGAINTGNNLLFLLFGLTTALIIASGILSEAVIRKLEVVRNVPTRIVAGMPAIGTYRLQNEKGYASLSILINDPGAIETHTGIRYGMKRSRWWQFWRTSISGSPIASAYTPRLIKNADVLLRATYEFPVRGEFELPTMTLSTGFPFGFFEKIRRIDTDRRVIVLPRSESADEWVQELFGSMGEELANRVGTGEEFFSMRDYVAGDDHRKILWKQFAKRSVPVVRQNELSRQIELHLVLDTWTGSMGTPVFEQLVEKTAGFVDILIARGVRVTLQAGSVTSASTDGGRDGLLRHLAVVRQSSKKIELDSDPVGVPVLLTSKAISASGFAHVLGVGQ